MRSLISESIEAEFRKSSNVCESVADVKSAAAADSAERRHSSLSGEFGPAEPRVDRPLHAPLSTASADAVEPTHRRK